MLSYLYFIRLFIVGLENINVPIHQNHHKKDELALSLEKANKKTAQLRLFFMPPYLF